MQQGTTNTASEINFEEFAPATYAEWRSAAESALKGADFDRTLITKLVEGLALQPIYNESDVASCPGNPGQFPYRRGTTALGYTIKPWEVAQAIPACSAKTFNEHALQELKTGGTALTIKLNCGGGLKLRNAEAWSTALAGIELDCIPVYTFAGGCGLGILGMYVNEYTKRGLRLDKMTGGVLYDPIGKLVGKGKLCGGKGICAYYDQLASMTKWVIANTKNFQSIGVSGLPYHNSGCTATEEVAIMIATAVAYLRALEERGISISDAAPRIRFTTGIGSNVFLEIAKIRALRELWAKVVVACGGSEESAKINLHAVTSTWTLSKVDPWSNMLRGTAQAFSAAIGGVDSLEVTPFDAAVRRPDEFSRRIARNLQLVLQGECILDRVVDPAGGSYYIENLTDTVEKEAYAIFQSIEAEGGILASLKAGTIQKRINVTAAKRYELVDQRRQTIVGINRYVNLEEESLATASCPAPGAPNKEMGSEESLALVGNSMEQVLAAIKAGACTCGIQAKLCDCSSCGCDSPLDIEAVPARRITERFEELLDKAAAWKKAKGSRPSVFLATFGPLRQFKPRADFTQDFLRAGGFDATYSKGYNSPEEAATAAVASGLGACVICSTDDTYPEIVPAYCAALKAAKPDMLIFLAGYPKEHIAAFEAAGVDGFIHVKANCYETLNTLQNKLGI